MGGSNYCRRHDPELSQAREDAKTAEREAQWTRDRLENTAEKTQ